MPRSVESANDGTHDRLEKEPRPMANQPPHPFHPGEMLREEFLDPLGLSQTAFAQKIGWSRARLNEVICGKRGVTVEAALDLADTLGTSPKLWLNLQTTYDLDKASIVRWAEEHRAAAQGTQ